MNFKDIMPYRLPDDNATEINVNMKIRDTEGNKLLDKDLYISLKEWVRFFDISISFLSINL